MTNTLNKIIHNGDEYELPRQKALVITLTSAGWTNNEQTVTATGVTASNSIIISPVPTYISDYTDAKIYCSAQGTDSLTFTCDTTPSNDIEVNVLVLSAEIGSGPTPPSPWQPGVNTVAYYPLTSDTNDETGNYNLTPTDITYTTLSSGLSVATFNGSSSKAETASFSSGFGTDYTISTWVYGDGISSTLAVIRGNATSDSAGRILDVYLSYNDIRFLCQPQGYIEKHNSYQNATWYNIVISCSSGAVSMYINSTFITVQSLSCVSPSTMFLGYRQYNNDRYWKGYMSRVIIEDKARTPQEISDYYNLTKGDYGIS